MVYLVPIALLGWIPLSLVLFVVLRPHQAVICGIVGAWLLLPPASLAISGLPDYDKSMASTVGICLATLIFQPNRLLGFRPRWFDVVVVAWCACPLISSLANGLGIYDGFSAMLTSIVNWALPYFIGRLYFGTLEELRDLSVGVVVGGLLYVLPTVFEMRMSPLLRQWIYGLAGAGQAGLRFGGYRPFVFLRNGLEHGMWMTIVSLLAVWLRKSGTLNRIGPVPMGSVLLPVLLVTTVLCRSSGALFLLFAGLLIIWICTKFRFNALMYALLLVSPVYYALRIPNVWTGEDLVSLIAAYYSQDRADSLGLRFRSENLLVERAMEQPLWGWAGWGRSRVLDRDGRDRTPMDGMWVIYLGQYGSAGLAAWTLLGLLPAWLFCRRFPTSRWADPAVGPAAAWAVLLAVFQIDCLVNASINLPVLTAAGGLIGIVPAGRGRGGAPRGSEPGRLRDPAPDPVLAAQEDSTSGSPSSPHEKLADRYAQLARSLRSQGSAAEAKAALIHALDLLTGAASCHQESPSSEKRRWDCTNDLAWLLLTEHDSEAGDPDLAVRLATRATEAEPGCSAYWNTLGAALLRIGDADNCIAALEHSMSLSGGGTAFDFLYLALAHARLNEDEAARCWYQQAASWMATPGRGHPDLARLEQEVHERLTSTHAADE